MRVVVAFDARLDRLPDGSVWWDGSLEYSFWRRYLDVFGEVRVVARVRDVPEVPAHARQLDGPQVTVSPIPYFVGPWQFARRYFAVRRAIRAILAPEHAAILRVPGIVATCLADVLRAARHPYAVEVIADPYDVFAPGVVRSVLRPFMRWWYPRNLRRHCAGACAAAYVTMERLQRRYPPARGIQPVGCSDIDLRDEAYVAAPRPVQRERPQGPRNLVLVGSLEQLYKGPDLLIDAVAANVARGLDVRANIVGDGRHRAGLEQQACARGVADRVRFTGRLPAGPAVRAELDRAELFVMPSRTEGLPRVLIEAMARGLPCLASAVGGIPELLPPEDLLPPGDKHALAEKIHTVLNDPERLARMSARNLAKARQYHADVLWARRRAFYEEVRDLTADWLRRSTQPRVQQVH